MTPFHQTLDRSKRHCSFIRFQLSNKVPKTTASKIRTLVTEARHGSLTFEPNHFVVSLPIKIKVYEEQRITIEVDGGNSSVGGDSSVGGVLSLGLVHLGLIGLHRKGGISQQAFYAFLSGELQFAICKSCNG